MGLMEPKQRCCQRAVLRLALRSARSWEGEAERGGKKEKERERE